MMTAAELRRLAARCRTIAAARVAAADSLVGVVRACSGGLADVASRSRASWTGRAAAGFLGVVHERKTQLDLAIDGLRHDERTLRQDAQARRDEAARLERLADELEAGAATAAVS